MSGQACTQFVETMKSSKRDVLSSVCLNNLGAPRFDALCTNTGRKTHGERPKKCNVGHEIAGGKSDGHSAHLIGHSEFKRAGVQKKITKKGGTLPLRRRHRSAAAACCARKIGSGHHTHVKKEFQIWNIKRGISFLAYPPQGCIRIRLINRNVVRCCVDELAVSSAAINHQIERPVACTTH